MNHIEVTGGPTEEESAAIAAVVAHVVAEVAEVGSAPPQRPRQSDWVMAWRPRVPHLRAQPEAPKAAPSVDGDEADER